MLGNFVYYNPTKLYFGKDAFEGLKAELKNYGKNVLFTYVGDSIKKIYVYDDIIRALKENNKNVIELNNLMPTPTFENLQDGMKLARENNIDFILALGDESVCDYAKAIAAFTHYTEEQFEKSLTTMEKVDVKIIPFGTIPTMIGTGSKLDGGRFNINVGELFNDIFPEFSIFNPELTFTVPEEQMTTSIFYIMTHILKQYFSENNENTSDYIIEGLLKSLIHSSKIAIKEPNNYEARSNIMWIATSALTMFIKKGKPTNSMLHKIGQAVEEYTNAKHGTALPALALAYYSHMPCLKEKFVHYAINVWGVETIYKSKTEIAEEGLEKMKRWMQEMKLVLHLKELNITEEMIESIAYKVSTFKDSNTELTKDKVLQILKKSL
ncbi:MAG: iron-containing alcohol dehydrogenase [Treponema sp.]